jgi:hypothetical protein
VAQTGLVSVGAHALTHGLNLARALLGNGGTLAGGFGGGALQNVVENPFASAAPVKCESSATSL